MNGERVIGLIRKAVSLLRAGARHERDRGDGGSPARPRSKGPSHDRPTTLPTTRPATRPADQRRAPSADSELGGARVEYSPRLDGDADPGEVVWTWVPYEDDPSRGKDRPVMIFGRRGDRLVGVALTSKRHDNEPQIAVGTGSWDREGRPSYAKLERIVDVDPTQVRREGAVLPRARFDDVVDALRSLHGLVERPG